MAYAPDQSTPDDVQEAKAKRVSEQIRLGMAPEPIEWQDDEAINQDVLERDIILAGDIPPEVREAAKQRWIELATQASSKQGAPPAPGPQGPGQGGPEPMQGPMQGPPAGIPMPPEVQPLFASGPGIATAPPSQQMPQLTGAPNAVPVQ